MRQQRSEGGGLPARQLTAPATLATAIALVVALCWGAAAVPPPLRGATMLLGTALVLLAHCDLRHFRLPDMLTLPLILAGLATSALLPAPDLGGHLAGAAAGFAVLAVLGWGHHRLTARDGIGGGDVKLLAAGGAWLGWQALPALMLIAALGGIGWALVAARGKQPDGPVPFGVPLSATIWLLWLYGVPGYSR